MASTDGRIVKDEIPWSETLKPELKNANYFFVHTVSQMC